MPFRRNPPHTVAEVRQRIKDETGVERVGFQGIPEKGDTRSRPHKPSL